MEVDTAVVGPLATNSYLICERDECLLVDPGGDAAELLGRLGRRVLVAMVATHLHFDHVAAVAAVAETTGAPFYAHPADWEVYRELNSMAEEWGFELPELPAPKPPGGRLWRLEVIHTPGHTPGSISLAGDNFVLTGDTLFHMSVGRTDLPYGSWRQLVQSLCALLRLPPDYVVYPGHGPRTYIGVERRENPYAHYCMR
ncbi:MAG: MBL fold metallo-hydrolase [Pyrobaculum sp.]